MLCNFVRWLLILPPPYKNILAIAVDAGLCAGCTRLTFYLYSGSIQNIGNEYQNVVSVLSSAILISIFWINGSYTRVYRHLDIDDLNTILKSTGLYATIFYLCSWFLIDQQFYFNIVITQPLFLLAGLITTRMVVTFFFKRAREKHDLTSNNISKALVCGAGSAGQLLVRGLRAECLIKNV